MADLSIEVDGLKFENPFIIGSGPPGSNASCINRAFDQGWAGVSCKTLALENEKVHNVAPRYARLAVKSDDKLKHTKIILLTAKGQDSDRAIGVEAGADDYMTKPFSPTKILERARAALGH